MILVNEIIWISSVQSYDTSVYCIACPPPEAQIVFHHYIFGPLDPLLHPQPLFPLITIILSSLCDFQFYMTHTSEVTWFLTFPDLFYLAWYSQGQFMSLRRRNENISSFLVAEHYSIVPHLYPIPDEGHCGCAPVMATTNNAAMNTEAHMSWWINVFKFFR